MAAATATAAALITSQKIIIMSIDRRGCGQAILYFLRTRAAASTVVGEYISDDD